MSAEERDGGMQRVGDVLATLAQRGTPISDGPHEPRSVRVPESLDERRRRALRGARLVAPKRPLDQLVAKNKRHERLNVDVARWHERIDVAIEEGWWMTIIGRPGAGKTNVLRIIGERAAIAGLKVLYTTFRDLLMTTKAKRSEGQEWDERHARMAFGVWDLVLVDEVFPVFNSLDDQNVAHVLLDERYERGSDGQRRATVLAGNLDWKTFESVVGEAAADRCKDGSVHACDWDSFRGPKT